MPYFNRYSVYIENQNVSWFEVKIIRKVVNLKVIIPLSEKKKRFNTNLCSKQNQEN